MYEYDMNGLEALGRDIVSSVEIRVEDGVPRLVLNVTNNHAELDKTTNNNGNSTSNGNNVNNNNGISDEDGTHQMLSAALSRSRNASPVKGIEEDETFVNSVLTEGMYNIVCIVLYSIELYRSMFYNIYIVIFI